jgi:hypothetical protein
MTFKSDPNIFALKPQMLRDFPAANAYGVSPVPAASPLCWETHRKEKTKGCLIAQPVQVKNLENARNKQYLKRFKGTGHRRERLLPKLGHYYR